MASYQRVPIKVIQSDPLVWRDGSFDVDLHTELFVDLSPNFLSPTICSDSSEPIRRRLTPPPNRNVTVEAHLESDDSFMVEKLKDNKKKFFHMTTPDVIESDYFGQCRYTHGMSVHIHAIVKNSLQKISDMALGTETSYQFDGKVGKAYNKMVLGMMYQWKLSCLELFEEVQHEEDLDEYYFRKQKDWIHIVLPRLMCAIEDFHGLIPLVILQKHLLKTYLGEEVCKDDEQLAFLWHMINCRSYEIVPILGSEEF